MIRARYTPDSFATADRVSPEQIQAAVLSLLRVLGLLGSKIRVTAAHAPNEVSRAHLRATRAFARSDRGLSLEILLKLAIAVFTSVRFAGLLLSYAWLGRNAESGFKRRLSFFGLLSVVVRCGGPNPHELEEKGFILLRE